MLGPRSVAHQLALMRPQQFRRLASSSSRPRFRLEQQQRTSTGHKLAFAAAAAVCGGAAYSVKLAAEDYGRIMAPEDAARATRRREGGPPLADTTSTLLVDPAPLVDPDPSALVDSTSVVSVASTPTAKSDVPTSGGVSVSKTHPLMLAGTGLDDEQKLQIALCRRQSWVRAAQLGPLLGLGAYTVAALVDATRIGPLPRGSRAAAPMVGCVVGMVLGSYYGGMELKPRMNQALLERPVAGVHQRGAARTESVQRAAQEAAAAAAGPSAVVAAVAPQ